MLLEIAVADAYAIPFEFVDDPAAHGLVNNLLAYQQNPRYDELLPTQYTDDTLRSIATARAILDCHHHDLFNPLTYIEKIQEAVRDDLPGKEYRKGWSSRFQIFLEGNLKTKPLDFARNIKPRRDTNGALMGCLPLAYLPDIADIKMAVAAQAIATHSLETAPYSEALVLAAWYLRRGGEKSLLAEFLSDFCEPSAKALLYNSFNINKPIGMTAKETTKAVLYLLGCGVGHLKQHTTLTQLLYEAVELRGDTDSVAALTLGIASCSKGISNDLPRPLIDDLDTASGFATREVAERLNRLDLQLQQFAAKND